MPVTPFKENIDVILSDPLFIGSHKDDK